MRYIDLHKSNFTTDEKILLLNSDIDKLNIYYTQTGWFPFMKLNRNSTNIDDEWNFTTRWTIVDGPIRICHITVHLGFKDRNRQYTENYFGYGPVSVSK